jgi:hypothetical protein
VAIGRDGLVVARAFKGVQPGYVRADGAAVAVSEFLDQVCAMVHTTGVSVKTLGGSAGIAVNGTGVSPAFVRMWDIAERKGVVVRYDEVANECEKDEYDRFARALMLSVAKTGTPVSVAAFLGNGEMEDMMSEMIAEHEEHAKSVEPELVDDEVALPCP